MYNTSIARQNSFNAQVTFVDHTVANVTQALMSKGRRFFFSTATGAPESHALPLSDLLCSLAS
jgi:hypothetical protein